jgi:hypothetical protein
LTAAERERTIDVVIGWGPRRLGVLTATACAIALTAPGSASALTPLGATFTPLGCSNNITHIQGVSAGNQYTVPSAGVITSWSHQGGGTASYALKIKVARPVIGDFFTIIGESALTPIAGGTSNGPFPIRLPVRAGDVLGLYTNPGPDGPHCYSNTAGHSVWVLPGDRPLGATDDYDSPTEAGFGGDSFRLDVSAILEPDADGDDFGDETQDGCPTDASAQGACPEPAAASDTAPPDTTITAGPEGKSKKKTATFSFGGTDARAVASFECKLDSGGFEACTSPKAYSGLKKGSHTFSVRAVDAAGNVDPTPATRTWKVKRKKKKK